MLRELNLFLLMLTRWHESKGNLGHQGGNVKARSSTCDFSDLLHILWMSR